MVLVLCILSTTVLKLHSGYDFKINNYNGALLCKKRSKSYSSYSLHVV